MNTLAFLETTEWVVDGVSRFGWAPYTGQVRVGDTPYFRFCYALGYHGLYKKTASNA
jgi:hypothetical protein